MFLISSTHKARLLQTLLDLHILTSWRAVDSRLHWSPVVLEQAQHFVCKSELSTKELDSGVLSASVLVIGRVYTFSLQDLDSRGGGPIGEQPW